MTATSAIDVTAAARRWADFFEALTPDSLADLDRHCTDDVRFTDPFNDVRGVTALRRVFTHMFDAVDAPVFQVTDIAVSGRTAYLRWDFSFHPKGRARKTWTIAGVSEVLFDAELKVVSHVDHWDAGGQFYARLPILNWLIRLVRSRVTAD